MNSITPATTRLPTSAASRNIPAMANIPTTKSRLISAVGSGGLRDLDNDRVLLQQTQGDHQPFRFCALQAAASSASSTSVRTPTPVAPFG